jgi:rhomboid protease GluP
MRCAHCGNDNIAGARTCERCGVSLFDPGPAAAFERAFATVTPHAFVTPALIAANVLLFLFMTARGVAPLAPPPADVLVRWGALYGPAVTQGDWWRLATAIFMHAGAPHLLFNMWALFSVGLLTERMFGNSAFLIVYLLAGLGGGLTGLYWHPMTATVGASGAIFGLYGALFAFLLRQHATIPRHFVTSVGLAAAFFLFYNLFYGLRDSGIDMAGHVGGLLTGGLAGFGLAGPLVVTPLRVRVRRNLLVGGAGLAVLLLAAARLPPVDDFPDGLRTLTALEQKNVAAVNAALVKLRAGQLTGDQFAAMVDSQLLPPWRTHRAVLARLRLPPHEHELAGRAVKYMDLRTEEWSLAARGVKRHDSELIRRSNLSQQAANEAATAFMKAVSPNAPPPPPAPVTAIAIDEGGAALQQEVERLQATERRAVDTYNDHVAQVRSGALSNADFAARVETVLLPEWTRQYERFVAMRATGAVETRRAELAEYMRLRGEAWRLTAEGMRTQSPDLLKQGAAAEARAKAVIRPAIAPHP